MPILVLIHYVHCTLVTQRRVAVVKPSQHKCRRRTPPVMTQLSTSAWWDVASRVAPLSSLRPRLAAGLPLRECDTAARYLNATYLPTLRAYRASLIAD